MIENLDLDRSSWSLVKFGDVALKQTESVDRENTNLTKYIKGEHMNSEDIHIRSWGELTDEYLGPAFIRKFEEGDILYGSRRTYLKKVAVAHFEGITSNTTFVIKPNEELIHRGLLPFIMLSDAFTDHSIKNSKGSVNPYINWKDLAKYEFLLPPKGQQGEIAELLWAMDEMIEKNKILLKKLNYYKRSFFKTEVYSNHELKEFFFSELNPFSKMEKVGKYLKTVQYGISNSLSDEGDVPILRMNNLVDGKVDLTDLKYYSPEDGELDKFYLETGDVLFNRTNSFDLVGKTGIYLYDKKISFASYLIRIQTKKEKLDSSFLNFYMNTEIGISRIRNYRTPGVSQSNINAQNLKSMPIPVPPIEKQKLIMEMVNRIERIELQTEELTRDTSIFLKSLLNQIF